MESVSSTINNREESVKMGFIFNGLFWGILVILIGVGIIINVFFNIKLPIGKIVLATMFIGIGLSILLKAFGPNKGTDVVFDHSHISYSKESKEYNVIFGKGVFDLSHIKPVEDKINIAVSCVFGEAEVVIDKNLPLKIKVSSAFAGAFTPDGNNLAFGENVYTSPAYNENKPYISIKANVVFGALHFLESSSSEKK